MLARQLIDSVFKPKTRRWKGFDVDVELKDQWLVDLNAIRGAHVVSVCSGHSNLGPDGITIAGGSQYPSVNFDVSGLEFAKAMTKAARDAQTKADMVSWGGPYENWVLYSNGKPRDDPHIFDADAFKKYPLESCRHSVLIDSKVPRRDGDDVQVAAWWEGLIQRLQRA
jgi:hypothetical protein